MSVSVPYTDVDNLLNSTAPVKAFAKGTASRLILDAEGRPYHRTDDDDQICSRFFADTSDTGNASAPMTMVLGSFDNASGAKNLVGRWGLNIDDGGTRVDSTRPMIGHEHELDYLTGGKRYAESHIAHYANYSGAPLRRPYSFFLRNDAAPTLDADYVVEFEVRRATQKWLGVEYLMTDLTNGLRAINIPMGTAHSTTTVDHLILRGPTSQTGQFAKFIKNDIEFGTLSPYGELTIDGSVTGSGTSTNSAQLRIKGRTGTDSVVLFEDRSGSPKLQMSAVTGEASANLMYGQSQFYGQYISVGPYNASAQNFLVNGTGEIYTNQTSSGGPAGAVVGKMPVYRSGTFDLFGYIEIKALS